MVSKLASVPDYEDHVRAYLSKPIYDYLSGYSEDGHTKVDNEKDFEYIKLKLRGMINMKHFKGIETTILGHKISTPICISPIDFQTLFHLDGEIATA
jgi:isopentenyl diphosphate isomerase/L-lactate dehydrogenase-like FMN-dependent dehydrogenase